MSAQLEEQRLDSRAACDKIRRLSRELRGICEAYGLDLPEGCDDSIPLRGERETAPTTPIALFGSALLDAFESIDPNERAELLERGARFAEYLGELARKARAPEGIEGGGPS